MKHLPPAHQIATKGVRKIILCFPSYNNSRNEGEWEGYTGNAQKGGRAVEEEEKSPPMSNGGQQKGVTRREK